MATKAKRKTSKSTKPAAAAVKIVKATATQRQAAALFIGDIRKGLGIGEAIARSAEQFVKSCGGKRSEQMMRALAPQMQKMYPEAVITVAMFAGKWNVKFVVNEVGAKAKKAGNTARQFWNRNVLPHLPALSTSGKSRKGKAQKKDPVKRAQDGIMSAAKAIRKAHKQFGVTRAQILEAVRLAFSRAKLA